MAFFSRFPGSNTFLEEVLQDCVIALKVDVKCCMLISFFALNYSHRQDKKQLYNNSAQLYIVLFQLLSRGSVHISLLNP